jgi:hypothetical protein
VAGTLRRSCCAASGWAAAMLARCRRRGRRLQPLQVRQQQLLRAHQLRECLQPPRRTQHHKFIDTTQPVACMRRLCSANERLVTQDNCFWLTELDVFETAEL